MKVLDAILLAYDDCDDFFKKKLQRAYKYVKYNRKRCVAEEINTKDCKSKYLCTMVLNNGLSVSVKRTDLQRARWILWYKAIEHLAFSDLYFEIKYKSKMLTYTMLDYSKTDYTRKYKFKKAKFVDRYEPDNKVKKLSQPSLF